MILYHSYQRLPSESRVAGAPGNRPLLVACDAAIFIEGQEYQLRGIDAWRFIFRFIAIVFKSISPTNLSREMWASLDVVVEALFGLYAFRNARGN